MKITALFITLAFISLLNDAFASEKLRFVEPESFKDKQIVDFIAKSSETSTDEYILAHIDLNNDAIDEYIVKPKLVQNCPKAPLCPYSIMAFENRLPISLKQFDAHKILISNKKTYGVRGIIVYNDFYNDFKFKTFNWSPYSFQYESFD